MERRADTPAASGKGGAGMLDVDGILAVREHFVDFHEGYLRHHIAQADGKATILFGLASALLTYLFGQHRIHAIVVHWPSTWPAFLSITALALLAASAACAVLVVAPRLHHTGEGIVFFGAVAAYSSGEDYVHAVESMSSDDLTAARLRHSFDSARVCTHKYSMLRSSIWLGFSGVLASLPLLSLL